MPLPRSGQFVGVALLCVGLFDEDLAHALPQALSQPVWHLRGVETEMMQQGSVRKFAWLRLNLSPPNKS